jgi:hypothetical protein
LTLSVCFRSGALHGGKLLDVMLFSRGPVLRAVFALVNSTRLGWFATDLLAVG